jgi:LacI family transcriptional regulator
VLINKIRKFKKSSIRDVAAAAGVSVTTVSYFVNGRETVCSPDTAIRIRNAIDELHFTPSSATRGIRERATNTIGVIVDDPVEVFNRPYTTFSRGLWSGIVEEADMLDYGLLHYPASVRHGTEYARLLDGRVDGALISPVFGDHRPALTARAGLPTVILNRYADIADGCGAACSQEDAVVEMALSHLWNLGHRRIALIAGPDAAVPAEMLVSARSENSEIAAVRRSLAISWLTRRSAYDQALLATSGAWTISCDDAMRTLRTWFLCPEPPTAVFCADDAIALSVMEAARRLGLAVPGHLSIIGIDNAIESRECDPGLTTIEIPVQEIGRQGVKALIRMMHGDDLGSCRCWIAPTGIVERASTGLCPVRGRRLLCK